MDEGKVHRIKKHDSHEGCNCLWDHRKHGDLFCMEARRLRCGTGCLLSIPWRDSCLQGATPACVLRHRLHCQSGQAARYVQRLLGVLYIIKGNILDGTSSSRPSAVVSWNLLSRKTAPQPTSFSSLCISSHVPSIIEKFSSKPRIHGFGADPCQIETFLINFNAISTSGTVLCLVRTSPFSSTST